MYKNYDYFLSLYYRIVDLVFLNLSFFVGIFLRFRNEPSFSFFESNYASLLLFINITWLFTSSFQKIYSLGAFSSKNRYYAAVAIAILLQLFISIGFNGLIKTFYSRLFLLFTYGSFSVLLIVGRIIVLAIFKKIIHHKLRANSIVILGNPAENQDVIEFLNENLTAENQQIIQLENKLDYATTLNEINEKTPISELFLPMTATNEEELEEITTFCDNNFIRLRLIFDWKKISLRKLVASKYGQTTVLKVSLTPLDDPYNALLKRTADIVISSLAVIFIFSWLFPIIALFIKITSPGPVFFKQERSGLNNKTFKCIKFRSMKVNAAANTQQATKGDTRITSVGAFLRRTSLDELPQFLNVLKGQMSIVGPRPHMLKHTKDYSKLVGNFMNRHAIKPGITGLAQIRGYRGEISDFVLLNNRIRFDRFYVNNWTLFFDFKIIFLTVFTIFKPHR